MQKKDDREKEDEFLSALLQIGLILFGKSDPAKAAERRQQMRILNSLEYPGGKRIR